jgi:hypothetical protein
MIPQGGLRAFGPGARMGAEREARTPSRRAGLQCGGGGGGGLRRPTNQRSAVERPCRPKATAGLGSFLSAGLKRLRLPPDERRRRLIVGRSEGTPDSSLLRPPAPPPPPWAQGDREGGSGAARGGCDRMDSQRVKELITRAFGSNERPATGRSSVATRVTSQVSWCATSATSPIGGPWMQPFWTRRRTATPRRYRSSRTRFLRTRVAVRGDECERASIDQAVRNCWAERAEA